MTTVHSPSRDYILRRLHSLAGIIPVGAFLIMHLATNFLLLFNTSDLDLYQQQVDRIHALGPLLVPVEIIFIFAPLLFHAALGIKIWMEGRNNVRNYSYANNVRYMLQRLTGGIVLVFIIVHLWHMHWLGEPLGGGFFDPHDASATASHALQSHKIWAVPLYAIGIMAACYHLGNGLWTAMISWGVTIGPVAQHKMARICLIMGVAGGVIGLAALVGFLLHSDARPKVETAIQSAVQQQSGAMTTPGDS